MQEFYHLRQGTISNSNVPGEQHERNHQLAVVILFCTLGEVLLQHFLEECMFKMNLPQEIQDRLLNDNLFVKQRIRKLFPTLTGIKWEKAIGILNESTTLNYNEAIEFYQRASNARNEFLHRGNKWAIPQEMPEQCIRHIWPLIYLFVELHNKYVVNPIKVSIKI